MQEPGCKPCATAGAPLALPLEDPAAQGLCRIRIYTQDSSCVLNNGLGREGVVSKQHYTSAASGVAKAIFSSRRAGRHCSAVVIGWLWFYSSRSRSMHYPHSYRTSRASHPTCIARWGFLTLSSEACGQYTKFCTPSGHSAARRLCVSGTFCGSINSRLSSTSPASRKFSSSSPTSQAAQCFLFESS